MNDFYHGGFTEDINMGKEKEKEFDFWRGKKYKKEEETISSLKSLFFFSQNE